MIKSFFAPKQQPKSPSEHSGSKMKDPMVLDIAIGLKTNDYEIGISALKSAVSLGREYPTDFLFHELIDVISTVENVDFDGAYAIYSAAIFCFDKAAACSQTFTFPTKWSDYATLLQTCVRRDVTDELCKRELLILQLYSYALTQDFRIRRARGKKSNPDWLQTTHIAALVSNDDVRCSKKKRITVKNNLIMTNIDCVVDLWGKAYERTIDDESVRNLAQDTTIAVLRVLELLAVVTDQMDNVVNRIEMKLSEKQHCSKKFFQVMQMPVLKMCCATSGWGLSHTVRAKNDYYPTLLAQANLARQYIIDENENAGVLDQGRMSILDYAESHLKVIRTLKPKTKCMKLAQEILQI